MRANRGGILDGNGIRMGPGMRGGVGMGGGAGMYGGFGIGGGPRPITGGMRTSSAMIQGDRAFAAADVQ